MIILCVLVLCTQVNMMQTFSQGPKRGRPILVQRYIYSKKGGGGGVGGSRKRSLENL